MYFVDFKYLLNIVDAKISGCKLAYISRLWHHIYHIIYTFWKKSSNRVYMLLYCGGLYCDVWLYQRYYTPLTLHKIDSNTGNNIYSSIPLNKLHLHE